MYRTEQTLTPYGHVTNAVLTGAATSVAVNPAVVWKTNAQNNQLKNSGLSTFQRVLKSMPKTLGEASAGLKVNVIGITPGQALGFITHEGAKRLLDPGVATLGAPIIAGGFSTLVTAGPERFAIIQAVRKTQEAELKRQGKIDEAAKIRYGTKEIAREILAQEGFKGFQRGMVPTFARETAGTIGFFYAQDCINAALKPVIAADKPREIAASAVTGFMVGVITNPVDRIKTLMQANIGSNNSLCQVVKEDWNKVGWHGMTKGVLPRGFLLSAAMIASAQAKKMIPPLLPEQFHSCQN